MFEISCLVLFFILFISLNNFQNIAYVLTPFCFCSDVHNCILTLLQFYLLISFFFSMISISSYIHILFIFHSFYVVLYLLLFVPCHSFYLPISLIVPHCLVFRPSFLTCLPNHSLCDFMYILICLVYLTYSVNSYLLSFFIFCVCVGVCIFALRC